MPFPYPVLAFLRGSLVVPRISPFVNASRPKNEKCPGESFLEGSLTGAVGSAVRADAAALDVEGDHALGTAAGVRPHARDRGLVDQVRVPALDAGEVEHVLDRALRAVAGGREVVVLDERPVGGESARDALGVAALVAVELNTELTRRRRPDLAVPPAADELVGVARTGDQRPAATTAPAARRASGAAGAAVLAALVAVAGGVAELGAGGRAAAAREGAGGVA